MTHRISEASVVMRTTNQVCCDMGGESIILNLKSGIYFSVDEVGARIWALIEQPMSIAAIRDAIVAEYDVEPGACERDLRAFIEGMDAAGLIEVPIEVKHEVGA
jgi:coenzyme PQQ synthesis protein D (PqqD)